MSTSLRHWKSIAHCIIIPPLHLTLETALKKCKNHWVSRIADRKPRRCEHDDYQRRQLCY